MTKKQADKKLTKALWQFKRAEQGYIRAHNKAKKLVEAADKEYDKALKVFRQAQVESLYAEDK